jgi:hypothetical protein
MLTMLFMVIERYRSGEVPAVYRRFQAQGRLAPEGLRYVSSWVDVSLSRCFQLMECDDVSLLGAWIAQWHDLVEFEVVPVLTSEQAAQAVTPLLR